MPVFFNIFNKPKPNSMCKCNSSNKNQTSKEIFDFLDASTIESAPGIGLFIIPAPELGIMEYKSVFVEGLTYKETVKRGQICEAFKFFPLGIKLYTGKDKSASIAVSSVEDIEKLYCAHGRYCDGTNCYGTCACVGSYLVCYQY